MQKITIALIIFLLITICGCAEKTPLEKLASNQKFDNLNSAFWGKEANEKTKLWQQAVNYCKGHTQKPNCGTVMETLMFHSGSTEVPAYGTSGHTLTAPEPKL